MPIPADYQELPMTDLEARHVEAFWSFDTSSSGEHFVLPDGRMDLLVRFQVRSGATWRSLIPADYKLLGRDADGEMPDAHRLPVEQV